METINKLLSAAEDTFYKIGEKIDICLDYIDDFIHKFFGNLLK